MTSRDPILEAFGRLAARDPARPLAVSVDRSARAGEIQGLAAAVAEALAHRRVEPGRLVGLSAPNGPGFLAGLLALRRCGAAAVLLDPTSSPRERARILDHVGATHLLSVPPWPEHPEDFRLDGAGPGAREPRWLADDVAVVKLTSGTAGTPRGVVTPSEALVADDAQLARSMGLRDAERILAAIPMSHSYGLSSLVMPALMRGSTLVVPTADSPFSGLDSAIRCRITFLPTSPAFLAALVRASSLPPLPPSLRRIISAGAPLLPDIAHAFRRRFGARVHVFYGASESGGICYDREGDAAEAGTVGTPVDGVRVSIEPQPHGDGLLAVESPAVARGYLADPDARLAGGRFLTSDVARWRDGAVELAGRVDDVINIRGRKVNPREVEGVLLGHPAVREAIVLKVQEGATGERMRAVVACRPGTVSREGLLAWCRAHLADFKVPRSLILTDDLPRTSRGKPDREAILRIRPDAPRPRRRLA